MTDTPRPPIPETLKTCPFCGSDAVYYEDSYECRWIGCEECGTRTSEVGVFSKEDAYVRWNTRHNGTPDLEGLIEKLEAETASMESSVRPQSIGYVNGLRRAIAVVRQHQAERHRMPDGRPIFGEGSSHDIGKHLGAVCASEIPVINNDGGQAPYVPEHKYMGDAPSTRERESVGWQPIETAPTNGSRIIVSSPKEHWEPVCVRWVFALQTWEDDFGGVFNPTHWMPMPSHPTGIEGGK